MKSDKLVAYTIQYNLLDTTIKIYREWNKKAINNINIKK